MEKTLFLESGSVYHIYNRGTNKQTIFLTKKDYNHFLSLWEKYIESVAGKLRGMGLLVIIFITPILNYITKITSI